MAEYTAITPDGKYLLHYGVKGMKWGKHVSKKDKQVTSTNRKGGIVWPWTPKDNKGSGQPSNREVDTYKQSGSDGKKSGSTGKGSTVRRTEGKADNPIKKFRTMKSHNEPVDNAEKKKKKKRSSGSRSSNFSGSTKSR